MAGCLSPDSSNATTLLPLPRFSIEAVSSWPQRSQLETKASTQSQASCRSLDRVISTVDTQARHGHKSRARTFDGYKSHVSLDPDSELIAEVSITAGNAADRDVVDELIATDTTGEVAEQVARGAGWGVDRDGRLRLRRR
jgi:Transposase DDE domain